MCSLEGLLDPAIADGCWPAARTTNMSDQSPPAKRPPSVTVLQRRAAIHLRPTAPFDFDSTVHKPSHFPAPISAYEPGTYWRTMRFRGQLLGLRMRKSGSARQP